MSFRRTRFQYLMVAVALFTTKAAAGSKEFSSSVLPAVVEAQTPGNGSAEQPAVTLKVSTRMVAVQVVARDRQGHPILGLTANDFQVFEEVAPKSNQYRQKIATLRAVNVSDLAARSKGELQVPPGLYSNLISTQTVAVPPTVLLLDGINTDLSSQMQVRRQMAQMLDSIPEDTPVAAFLLSRQLEMIKGFTTNHQLLKGALQKAATAKSDTSTPISPGDGSGAAPAMGKDTPGLAHIIQQFENETVGYYVRERVSKSVDALHALANYLAGYPGRKNLIWVSSSFPISINPERSEGNGDRHDFLSQIAEMTNALADANVAIYPLDPGGVETYTLFNAGQRSNGSASGMLDSMAHDDSGRNNRQQSMLLLAQQTGGKVCTSDNDLGDCVKKAEEDSSSYYELGYYPHDGRWHGEFHTIIIKSGLPGAHLAYRRGYYAQREDAAQDKNQDTPQRGAALDWAACGDPLTSTSILLVVKRIATQPGGKTNYFVAVDADSISLLPTSNGLRQLALDVAVCAFDKTGKPLQFVKGTVDRKLTAQDFAAVQAQHGFPQFFELPPVAEAATVRLLVKDVVTGRVGSVNIPYVETPLKPQR